MSRQHGIFAVDIKTSNREKLPNGFLRVRNSNLTKHQVRPYLGKEVDDSAAMGWDPEKTYGVYCPDEELGKAAGHYNNLPFLMGHHDFDPANPPKEHIIGSTGSDAAFNDPYITNSLTVWDQQAIDAIETGDVPELSCGYTYDLDPKQGEFNGQPYHAIMRNIRPEHLALVQKGRAGSDVRVADADKPGHAYHGNQYSGGQAGARTAAKVSGAGTTTKKQKRNFVKLPSGPASVDIAKRKGVSPKEGESKYGKVRYADHRNKKYPIDTPEHVRAALSYWGQSKNRSKYAKADQAVIGERIRSAAKRLGIQTKTGDRAGFTKEIAMAHAKHTPSPLAHRVAGAIEATLRSKLAKDAVPNSTDLLALVDHVSANRFAKQVDGIVGAVQHAFKLEDAAPLRALLLDMAAEPEDEDMDDEDMDDEEEKDAKKAKNPDKKAEAVAKVAKAKADAEEEEAGEEDGEEDPAEDAKMKKSMKMSMKKSMDEAVAAAVQVARDEAKALRAAEKAIKPIVGDVDGFDSAEQVYRYALKQRGVDAETIHASALPAMVALLAKQDLSETPAHDAAPAGAVSRFDLSAFKRIG